ncbi:MAG TPA: hypothetical protein DHW49_04785 [Anaerolineae bacterium]|nr:hypothetical protein [Anaerolineae bacterium]
MIKWEYLSVVSIRLNGSWRVSFVNDKSFDEGSDPDLIEYLNQLGSQGWELICEDFDTFNSRFYNLENYKIEESINKMADELANKGKVIVSVTSFPVGDFGTGSWLVCTSTKIRRLRFKRIQAD